jgi:hypothetical protein
LNKHNNNNKNDDDDYDYYYYDDDNNNNSILHFNVLIKQLQEPITESAQDNKNVQKYVYHN